ncbi:MAG: hypothetical protein IPM14_05260 [bacterium]|nr:hypothetical protein [bacterium]
MKPKNSLEHFFFFNKKICSVAPYCSILLLTDILFNQLNRSTRNIEIRKLALNNILSNLFIAHWHGRYIVISKSPNTYTNYSWYGLKHYTYRSIIEWIEILISNGYINQAIGFYDNEKGKGKRSRINASEKLLRESKGLKNSERDSFSSHPYSKNIILKEEGLLRYTPSGKLIGKIKFLDEYNEFIRDARIFFLCDPNFFSSSRSLSSLDSVISIYHLIELEAGTEDQHTGYAPIKVQPGIQHPTIIPEHSGNPLLITAETNSLSYKEIDGQLYRVFNDGKFTRGGRFYGSFYQQLDEADRAKILINDSPVVEVDYSGFHLNMLYHLIGKQFDGDPYSAVDRPEVRDILKTLCLIVINTKDTTQALRALRDVIRKDWKLKKLKQKYQLDEKDLLGKFESVHSEISRFFCSRVGLELMYLDSEIAETILKHFTRRGIPCLCVHDSFLVPSQYEDELKNVMKTIYKKYIGFEPKLK